MVEFLFLTNKNIGFCIDTFDKKLRLFFLVIVYLIISISKDMVYKTSQNCTCIL